MTSNNVLHHGSCHCGAIKFSVLAPSHNLIIYSCNCSICKKKQNFHFIVPKSNFSLLSGQDYLTSYEFNTKKAKHLFCKICGVQSFYQPRSNPDGYGINPNCIDSNTIISTINKEFDGQNWEIAIENDKIIKELSKN